MGVHEVLVVKNTKIQKELWIEVIRHFHETTHSKVPVRTSKRNSHYQTLNFSYNAKFVCQFFSTLHVNLGIAFIK